MLGNNSLYAAYKARDARFDGRFFVGISTTGIYCRPVCRARLAKAESCSFYSTAAEAEQAGYRPCLLCRPELAPGSSITDATATLAARAARLLESNCSSPQSLTELAGQLGCTDRHLRRVFMLEYNVSPLSYLRTCRLLLAKSLLTDTSLSVLDIAMAAGFGSLRRFNEVFKSQYQLSPSALRKKIPAEKAEGSSITLALGYRPPYRFDEILKFLAGRAIPGVEVIKNGEYWRTVNLASADGAQLCGWICVGHKPQKNSLTVTISEALLPVLPQVLARVRHLFDLYCDPCTVHETLSSMNALHEGICVLGTRLPGCFDSFEMIVRAILGQQITVKAATTLTARFVAAYGKPLETDIPGLTHVFPTPKNIFATEEPFEDKFGSLGIIATRARAICRLAQALEQNEIILDPCAQPEAEMKKLIEIPGIGSWTAQYIAMRAMGWTDAFLETDAAIKKALAPRTPKEMRELSESWRPWRSYAVMNLWNSL